MSLTITLNKLLLTSATAFMLSTAQANEVQIIAADFSRANDNNWTVKVSLKHKDTGWEHYADAWKIVDAEGNELGSRILQHPHVNEQPFTRNLAGVVIPDTARTVYIEAHDKVHGWTKNRLAIDLSKAIKGQLYVESAPKPHPDRNSSFPKCVDRESMLSIDSC